VSFEGAGGYGVWTFEGRSKCRLEKESIITVIIKRRIGTGNACSMHGGEKK